MKPALVARAAAVLVLTLLVVVAPAGSAAAHGGGGSDATNYRIDVTDPGDPGLGWRVYGGDALIELTNRTGRPVEVLGYQGEPYLRFVPGDGVYENLASPAIYLNRQRDGNVAVPTGIDASAEPEWRRARGGDRFAWHDHRAHWMSATVPTAVAEDPGREHLVQSWTIPIRLDDLTVEAAGTLRWIPPVAWWPPIAVAAAVFAVVTVVVLLVTRPQRDRWPALSRTAIVLVWLVAVANLVRTVDDLAALPASVGQQVTVAVIAVFAVALIAALSLAGWRDRPFGFFGVGAAGLATVLLFAAGATDQLSASQLATILPTWIRRATIAASYTVVIPAFVATIVAACLGRNITSIGATDAGSTGDESADEIGGSARQVVGR
ncbi:MAG TPA: hypothetical protein VNQ73_14915 [Ilumatobacter sp.]|nr:hypothetical protein [Ilumatobacter sp.]